MSFVTPATLCQVLLAPQDEESVCCRKKNPHPEEALRRQAKRRREGWRQGCKLVGAKKVLIIECGAAETRAALLCGEEVVGFWFGVARGDEADDHAPRPGRRFVGRIVSTNKALDAVFVNIGDVVAGFLPLKKSGPAPVEGALIAVEIKSPPRQGKGAVLKLLHANAEERTTPGRIAPIDDPAIEAVRAIGEGAEEIILDDGLACAVLTQAGLEAKIIHEQHAHGLFDIYGAQEALAEAFDRSVALAGGGRIFIDEAQALTAIDVDTGDLSASSGTRLREKIVIAAAREVAEQVRLRNIGGHVAVDFPAIRDKAARARVEKVLRMTIGSLEGAGAASFSKSGLYTFTLPHHVLSLVDRFTEPSPATPAPGRRFTLDAITKTFVRRLQNLLRAEPSVRLHVLVGSALENYLEKNPQWIARLVDRYGARFEIVADHTQEERAFDFAGIR